MLALYFTIIILWPHLLMFTYFIKAFLSHTLQSVLLAVIFQFIENCAPKVSRSIFNSNSSYILNKWNVFHVIDSDCRCLLMPCKQMRFKQNKLKWKSVSFGLHIKDSETLALRSTNFCCAHFASGSLRQQLEILLNFQHSFRTMHRTSIPNTKLFKFVLFKDISIADVDFTVGTQDAFYYSASLAQITNELFDKWKTTENNCDSGRKHS